MVRYTYFTYYRFRSLKLKNISEFQKNVLDKLKTKQDNKFTGLLEHSLHLFIVTKSVYYNVHRSTAANNVGHSKEIKMATLQAYTK